MDGSGEQFFKVKNCAEKGSKKGLKNGQNEVKIVENGEKLAIKKWSKMIKNGQKWIIKKMRNEII